MSWFKVKSKVDVNSNKGDNIKNSNITINQNDSNAMMLEIYRSVGRLEGQCKCMLKDINYIKSKFEDMDDRLTKVELTPRQMMERNKLK